LVGHQVLPANPGDPWTFDYRIIRADGSSSPILKDPNVDPRQHVTHWSADATEPYVGTVARSTAPAGRKMVWHSLDFSAGVLRVVSQPTLYHDVEPKEGPLHSSQTDAKLNLSAVSRDVRSLWLSAAEHSDYQHCLICADASSAQLSPAGDAVFYVSQGIGYVRSFVRMSKDQFEKALAAATRSEMMSKSKQAALALLMFASDNDDKFPMKEADLLGILYPYLKDGELLRGFVYTFAGGDMKLIDRPAETEIGYVLGPGGRAVAYVDGHVVWRNDK
jgi:prepilin-type processing-associated H-X9-DG protein